MFGFPCDNVRLRFFFIPVILPALFYHFGVVFVLITHYCVRFRIFVDYWFGSVHPYMAKPERMSPLARVGESEFS